MKKISHNKPQLRFPQFTDAWKNEVFGNIFRERVEYPEEVLPLHSLTIDKGVVPKTKRYERSFLVKSKEDAYKVVHEDDFVFNPMNLRFGAIAKHSKKNKVLVSKYYNIFYSNRTHDPTFLELYLRTNKMIGYYNKMAEGTLIEKRRVHFSNFIEFTKPLPELSEQKQIANFFRTVNDWIAYLDKQITSLEEYRKGVIQKLFSGKIRFRDDDNNEYPDWEDKLLKNVFIRKTEKNKDNKISFVLTNSATEGIVSQSDYFDKDIANQNNLTNYYIVEIDDFVYNPRISSNAPVGPMKMNSLQTGVMSPLYTVLKLKKGNKYFYEKYFETNLWHRYMKRVANYGARHDRMAISNSDLMNMPIPYPSEEEQKKIVRFVLSIDRLLGLKKTQIEKAKEWKKGLLQQMFV